MTQNRYPCPCCAFLTLPEKPPGTYAVCPVCYWEDDETQFHDSTYEGGANRVSLIAARMNFLHHGASASEYRDRVRPPRPDEVNESHTVKD